MKWDSALMFTCSLIEYIGRERKLRRSEVVSSMGREVIARIYRHADVLHSEPIEHVADEYVELARIPFGAFDNVAACRYEVPDYWTIGEVYERLVEDVCESDVDGGGDAPIDGIMSVYTSWIDGAISDYNTDFYYQPRDYLLECYKAGEVL